MIISKSIYEKIIEYCPVVPPEVGGILGGNNGVIKSVCFDSKNKIYNNATYIPDVDNLNETIRLWGENNIFFMGMFHSHPEGQNVLSNDDIEYIKRIFKCMPTFVKELYFPIVIPKGKMIPYKAINQNHGILIFDDKIELTS